MNWLQLLGPIAIAFLQQLLNRHERGMQAGSTDNAFNAQLDQWANDIEARMRTVGAPAGGEAATGGLFGQVTELVAALRSRDLARIMAAIQDLLPTLFGVPGFGARAARPTTGQTAEEATDKEVTAEDEDTGTDYESMTVEQLHTEASRRNLAGRSGLDKAGLVKRLQEDDNDPDADE